MGVGKTTGRRREGEGLEGDYEGERKREGRVERMRLGEGRKGFVEEKIVRGRGRGGER